VDTNKISLTKFLGLIKLKFLVWRNDRQNLAPELLQTRRTQLQ